MVGCNCPLTVFVQNEGSLKTMRTAKRKGCRICRGDLPVGKDGRCQGCADAHYANISGMHYGDFTGMKKEKRERLKAENFPMYQKLLLADDGQISLPQCKACGEWIWDARRKGTCCKECAQRQAEAEARKAAHRGERSQTWKLDEVIEI